MAITLKRKRGAVSYKEPSSDEDLSESNDSGRERRSKRSIPSRRSTRHRQEEDEDEAHVVHNAPPPPPTSIRKPQRTGRPSRGPRKRTFSYKDISTDEEDDPDADFEIDEEPARQPRGRPRRTLGHPPRSHKTPQPKPRGHRKLVIGAPLKPNTLIQAERKAVDIPTDGRKPAWATLPYHVLLQVFVYASHPLRDENMRPTPSIPWLVQVARMCSTFTKPALTALYRNPPIFAARHTRKDLVHHLINPPPNAHEEYRVMVKRLELDATQMTSLTDATHSVADLAALVQSLTTLREIDIFDPIDRPPFRDRLRRLRRWVYPNELFEALRQSDHRLRTWRWNNTFCDHGPLWMKSIHGDTAFQSLRELSLTKFHPDPSVENKDDPEREPTTEELLASALTVLPNLRVLSFETCGVVSGRLLPLLPTNLVSLNITNCGELLSDALQAFLASHGSHLEELVLNHNQSLSLSFLVDLKGSCPKLEVLRMDTTYYSSLAMSSDNEPLYETLLGEEEHPSWPSSLRVIDLEYLRNWNSTSATNLFSSLIDSAEDLPWLRELTIMAMVDTDWRQRAEFRMKWTAKFKKVFARKWIPPSPHLASLRAFREWKEQVDSEGKTDSFIDDNADQLVVPTETEKTKTVEGSDSDAPLVSGKQNHKVDDKWDTKRLRSRSKATANYDETSDSHSSSDDEASDEMDKVFVQGRCHTVIFRIDNFRPREEIFDEADFLDAEPSGDEEWNGNEENEEEGGYAW